LDERKSFFLVLFHVWKNCESCLVGTIQHENAKGLWKDPHKTYLFFVDFWKKNLQLVKLRKRGEEEQESKDYK